MSGSEVSRLISRIDASISESDLRIQKEVADYVDLHAEEVGEDIGMNGFSRIPTFAGDFFLSEAQLNELAGDANRTEEVCA